MEILYQSKYIQMQSSFFSSSINTCNRLTIKKCTELAIRECFRSLIYFVQYSSALYLVIVQRNPVCSFLYLIFMEMYITTILFQFQI